MVISEVTQLMMKRRLFMMMKLRLMMYMAMAMMYMAIALMMYMAMDVVDDGGGDGEDSDWQDKQDGLSS
eukprot:8642653-Pyramimonas_sp.AAC.1